MLLDMQSLFSDAQAITATAASTNVIDLGLPGTPQHAKAPIHQDLGKGRPIQLLVQIVESFNTLTSLTITMQKDTVENFASPETVMTTGAIALADLVAGKRLPPFYVPEGVDQRYLRLNYTVAGTAPTTGKVTAGLVFGVENWTP